MISLGRTDREQISLTHAAVNAPTPAPASNKRNVSRRWELVDAMSLAVAAGVKNCPSWLRRTRSSAPFCSFLASSAIASGSGISAASFKVTVEVERRPCRPFRAIGYTLRGRSGFTGTLRYPKSCPRFNVKFVGSDPGDNLSGRTGRFEKSRDPEVGVKQSDERHGVWP